MSILKYNEYLSEKVIYDILLESKVVYSNKFINILKKMDHNNRLVNLLLDLNKKDVDGISQNYIDITDKKDSVSFTPDRKAIEVNANLPEVWVVVIPNKNLTHSNCNDRIFKTLGYDKEKYDNPWKPIRGQKGIILKECNNVSNDKSYVLFQEYGVYEPRVSVLNKNSIQMVDDMDNKIWSTSRNNIKIGRLVRAILTSANISFETKEIEDFVNLYKSTFDFLSDAFRQFDIVDGYDISYWYLHTNYVSGGGSLNNSCMSEVPDSFLEIYSENDNVSMVILYSDNGKVDLEKNKYVSDKIKGRALLWNATIDGNECMFMDRIYTVDDSDVNLFKQFAEKNGWWYKKFQTMDPDEIITNGLINKDASLDDIGTILVKLNYSKFVKYPYIDTLCWLDKKEKTLSNKNGDILLKNTDGSYDEY